MKPASQTSKPRSASQAIRQQLDREAVRQWQERRPCVDVLSVGSTSAAFLGGEEALSRGLELVRQAREAGRKAYVSVY